MAKKWTKQEDEILVELIKKGKLPKALKEVSVSLGRSESAIYQRYISLKKDKKNKKEKSSYKLYTKEEEKVILDYITNPKNTNLEGLFSQLERNKDSIYAKIHKLKERYPELKIKRFTSAKISSEDLKQIMEKEITNNKHNLRQAFRNIADKTGLSVKSIEQYWYNIKTPAKGRQQLNRKNMPALFYTSDSKGASKNEKNTNVIQVHKGKYVFSMITSWLNRKFKVKSQSKRIKNEKN